MYISQLGICKLGVYWYTIICRCLEHGRCTSCVCRFIGQPCIQTIGQCMVKQNPIRKTTYQVHIYGYHNGSKEGWYSNKGCV